MQNHKFQSAATLCVLSAAMLSGCGLLQKEEAPKPAPAEPLVVTHRTTADPAHIRDVTLTMDGENRGGAALRAEGWHHVLYAARGEENQGLTGGEASGSDAAGTARNASAERTKEMKDAKALRRDAAAVEAAKRKFEEQARDASVYADGNAKKKGTDASIYADKKASANKVKGADASIYAKKPKSDAKETGRAPTPVKVHVRSESKARAVDGECVIGGHRLDVKGYDGKNFFWQDPETNTFWIGVEGDDRVSLFRIDEASMRIATLVETANVGTNLGTVDGKPVLSRTTRITFECGQDHFAMSQGADYDGYFAKGNMIRGYTAPSATNPASDETVRILMESACAFRP